MEDIDEGLQFLQTNAGINQIAIDKRDSRPAKQKVQAFKSRVFSLLLLFVEKAKDLTPLLANLSEQIFVQQPQKIHELLTKVLNRAGVDQQKLYQIAQFYSNFLLFRHHKNSQLLTEGFIRILRTLYSTNNQKAIQLIQEMLSIFLIKRKCKLQAGFFHFLLRKLPQFKPAILERCLKIEQNEQLRPAQQRVLQKLKKVLLGKQYIKVQSLQNNNQE